ncbi:MAG: transglutaminase domain-containing protein [Chitinophagales bacterium]|nr:transglutaminase domain-containing protein [Chitinophagales bacterium]
MNFDIYLRPTRFIDSNHAEVKRYAAEKTQGCNTGKEKTIALYYAVRDDILYDPYHLILKPEVISASQTLARGSGYCIEKSLLLCAAGRALGIPSRLGFSIVRNHLSTQKFVEMLRTDKFVFHGYNEFWLEDKWVKCTPAFNKSLCEKFGVAALEFDGEHDSIFHEFAHGKKYMEYLHEYGQFDDFPFDLFVQELRIHYPHLFEPGGKHAHAWQTGE